MLKVPTVLNVTDGADNEEVEGVPPLSVHLTESTAEALPEVDVLVNVKLFPLQTVVSLAVNEAVGVVVAVEP